jgi:UDP-N-acetylmuramoyl-tripeptide--D-alanyl-D-alanine ligase
VIVFFTLQELATLYGGEVSGPNSVIESIGIDTRFIQSEDLFVALKGERFDAHNHLEQAIEKGVRSFVIGTIEAKKFLESYSCSIWLVNDTVKALGHIAQYQRDHFVNPLVAITGSSGKTSVKGMLAAILSCYVGEPSVFATKGNFNNHIGVPLSLFSISPSHQYAVIEMGASGPREIAYLSAMAKPTVAVINNVMPAHVEGFGSVDAIATAKGEIYQGLLKYGCAIVNGDDVYANQWLSEIKQEKKIIFSSSGKTSYAGHQVQVYAKNSCLLSNGCYSFSLSCGEDSVVVKLGVLGQHNIENAVSASACAYALGVDVQFIRKGLEHFSAEKGRLQVLSGVNCSTLIDDSYNANPGSMKAAINVLSEASENSIFVMGDMGELGDSADEQHREIGVYAKSKGIRHLLTIGINSENTAKAYGESAQHFESIDSLIEHLQELTMSQPVVLVKGSRSSRMERVIQALKFTGDNNNASLAC